MEIWLVLLASTFGQYSWETSTLFHLVETVYQKKLRLIGQVIKDYFDELNFFWNFSIVVVHVVPVVVVVVVVVVVLLLGNHYTLPFI